MKTSLNHACTGAQQLKTRFKPRALYFSEIIVLLICKESSKLTAIASVSKMKGEVRVHTINVGTYESRDNHESIGFSYIWRARGFEI
ncbi:hypothetical protein ACFQPF_09440 [Fictibacillus iocasae]|uniref:Uncharacterized protein n=1 Tax=Fictibacillus iocasae TaxID=2715437 RepID=A0ABW2NNA0_9BACL